MLNTSLHNRSASMGGPFTYENFYHNLNGAIARQHMPDSSLIRVEFFPRKRKRFFFYSICLEYL
jgi:hypothetical protein